MNDEFDYDPPEAPLDCCSGLSRHSRLMHQSRTPILLPVASRREQQRLELLMQQLKRPARQQPTRGLPE